MDELMDPGGCVVPLETELAEARAQIAKLREALEDAASWCHICYGHRKVAARPTVLGTPPDEVIDCRHCEGWHKSLAATPSDCYAQIRLKIRAEVLEEAAAFVDANPLLTHMETAKKIRFDVMKDKP